jgi:hypothetical protein
MPMYIKITTTGDAQALLDSLRSKVRLENGKWFVDENGDFKRHRNEGDARAAQAFTPLIKPQRLILRFKNDGVYEPSDYAEYYGHFVEMLIRDHRTQFDMIRIQFDDEDELDVKRASNEDPILNMLPAKRIRTILEDVDVDPTKRIEEVLRLMKSFRY